MIRERVEQEKTTLTAHGRRAQARQTMLKEVVAALITLIPAPNYAGGRYGKDALQCLAVLGMAEDLVYRWIETKGLPAQCGGGSGTSSSRRSRSGRMPETPVRMTSAKQGEQRVRGRRDTAGEPPLGSAAKPVPGRLQPALQPCRMG